MVGWWTGRQVVWRGGLAAGRPGGGVAGRWGGRLMDTFYKRRIKLTRHIHQSLVVGRIYPYVGPRLLCQDLPVQCGWDEVDGVGCDARAVRLG